MYIYGFQKGKSTTLACFNLIHTIVTNLDKRSETTGIFFDMSKAFDFVSHKLLIDKLENYGIRGPALEWIKSYLSDRMQCVEIENIDSKLELKSHRSNYRHNKAGVPQRGVLSSLLFLIYINDLPEVTNHPCFLFADDISLIITSNNNDFDKYTCDINNTIESIITWLDANNLRVNLTKTNFIQFNTYGRKNKTININYRGHKLQEVNETTFLGITIDKHCNWKAHVNKVCNKINKFVYVLYELSKTSSLKTVLSAYYGYVDSVLRYGLIAWGYSTESQRVFLAQKKCIRAIAGIRPWESCKPFFKKFKIITLPSLYIFECAKFVKMHPELFTKAHEMFPKSTRHKNRLVLPIIPRTALYSKNSYAMCCRIFNALPDTIKTLPTNKFTRSLKVWLREKNFYSVNDIFKKGFKNY